MNRYNFTNAVTLWKNGLLEKQPNSKYWIVKKSFYFYIDYENKSAKYVLYDWYMIKNKIVVPVWFKTDIWTLFWLARIFMRADQFISFILHDEILTRKINLCKIDDYNYRLICDKILINAMRVEWGNIFQMVFVYIWIRIGAYYSLLRSLMGKNTKGKK
jgi:hypothetical protein